MGENNQLWIPRSYLKEANTIDLASLSSMYYDVWLMRWYQIRAFFGFEDSNVRAIDYDSAVRQLASVKKKDSMTKKGEDLLNDMQRHKVIFQAGYEEKPPKEGYISFDEFISTSNSFILEHQQEILDKQ